MIHYHGTPISPRKYLLEMKGKHFCVSHAHPYDLETVLEIGQSVMLDNGAFSVYTKGKIFDEKKYYQWIDEYLCHPHWAIIPDVIDGDISQQKELIKKWNFPKELSAPVFHLHLDLSWLKELASEFPKICLGSSGMYWKVGTLSWVRRMDSIFEMLSKHFRYLPWVHGLRMLSISESRYPLASVDSANVGRNFKDLKVHPEVMATRIDSKQNPLRYVPNPQMEIL